MASSREIRRLALQALFQLDASGEENAPVILDSLEHLDDGASFTPEERRRAFDLARSAFRARGAADAAMAGLAPAWPAHRQAAVDRALLRLAHYEITSGRSARNLVINEAVELAKAFSTEKSPSFINALLDRVEAPARPGGTAPGATEDEAG